jgi:carbon monoxide dehydrogenase subunit G
MAVIKTNIFINASPEDVFDFGVHQPELIPEWFEGVEAVEADDNYPEVGSQLHVTYKAAGVNLNTTGTVVELERGVVYAAEYKGMASGMQTWSYEAEGDGTRLSFHFDYEMAGGGIGKIVDKLLVERQNKKNAEQSLKNLKAMIEG